APTTKSTRSWPRWTRIPPSTCGWPPTTTPCRLLRTDDHEHDLPSPPPRRRAHHAVRSRAGGSRTPSLAGLGPVDRGAARAIDRTDPRPLGRRAGATCAHARARGALAAAQSRSASTRAPGCPALETHVAGATRRSAGAVCTNAHAGRRRAPCAEGEVARDDHRRTQGLGGGEPGTETARRLRRVTRPSGHG